MKALVAAASVICMWPSPATAIRCFEISNPDSSAILRLQLASQLQLVWEGMDKGGDIGRECALFTRVRRIRPALTLHIPNYRTDFRLHLSTAPGSIELMDLYFNVTLSSQLLLRAGQYKVPFTRYRIQSFQQLTFVDWAIVTKYFGAERQMGLAIHDGYEKPPVWGYIFGVFTGDNARASHTVGLAEIYNEVIPNPSSMADPCPKSEFHPELFLHLAHRAKGMRVQSDSDEDGGGLRYGIGTSASWDLDPAPRIDFHLRLASEVLFKYRGASLMGVGYAGFVRIGDPRQSKLAMCGGLIQASYRVDRLLEFSARYGIVDLRDALIRDASERVGTEGAELTIREEEFTFGLNCYLVEHALKWQNDVGCLRHSRQNGASDDLVARSQIQTAF